jgi:hypothetical protein
MDYRTHHFKRIISVGLLILLFCIGTLPLSGCTPLRNKFTRRKKKDEEQSQKFIPVLEPIDYPEKTYSSLERYSHHYSLWKVWEKDLLQTIDDGGSDKRQKYLLTQAIEQLEEMEQWLIDERREEFALLLESLRAVQQEYEKQPLMRNTFSLKKKIERNAKEIRNKFAPDESILK